MKTKKINADQIYDRIMSLKKIKVNKEQYYIKNDYYWKPVTEQEVAMYVLNTYTVEERGKIATNSVKEAIKRIALNQDFQLILTEEYYKEFINVKNGIYDLNHRRFIKDDGCFTFGYCLDFNYQEKTNVDSMPIFNNFIKSIFPEEFDEKRELLLQILGYVISDYTNAKAGFFFIGESNSGKSTILEILRAVLQEHVVSAVPLDRLNNKFSVARLNGKKVNICTELNFNSLCNSDIFKALTSSEIVTAEHKGRDPFEFQLRCKTINASNIIPELKEECGINAMLNRLVILYFPISISQEKIDLELKNKLLQEKDAIFSNAINALLDLKENNFRFIEPSDTRDIKYQIMLKGNVVENFIKSECILKEGGREYFCDLYERFQEYCLDNCIDVKITKGQFNHKLSMKRGLKRNRFRKNGGKSLWGIEGIEIKE